MIRIDNIEILGIGPFDELKINFNDFFNIICGPNGVGKTTLLECLGHSFARGRTDILTRNAKYKEGMWRLHATTDEGSIEREYTLNRFYPYDLKEFSTNGRYLIENAKEILVFKTRRTYNYLQLESVRSDPQKQGARVADEAQAGTISDEIKQWFVNRYMWSAHEGQLDKNQRRNFELAKDCFSWLDEEITFKQVESNTLDILLTTRLGEVYFEYFSSGYKSCLAVMLGLIKDIEFRFKNPTLAVQDFAGVVLIDEIDLHLHPEWQATIYKAIKKILPKAQIFVTTHSPHIIQVAEPQEIIALNFDDKGKVVVRELPQNEYGYQGWTLEEILRDVMGLKETRSEQYRTTIQAFEEALAEENYGAAMEAYTTLKKMLHDENHLGKLLRLQMAGLRGEKNDQAHEI